MNFSCLSSFHHQWLVLTILNSHFKYTPYFRKSYQHLQFISYFWLTWIKTLIISTESAVTKQCRISYYYRMKSDPYIKTISEQAIMAVPFLHEQYYKAWHNSTEFLAYPLDRTIHVTSRKCWCAQKHQCTYLCCRYLFTPLCRNLPLRDQRR